MKATKTPDQVAATARTFADTGLRQMEARAFFAREVVKRTRMPSHLVAMTQLRAARANRAY